MVGGNILDFTEYTTYSSNIKDVSVRLVLLIAVKNGLKLMDRDIINAFYTAPCAGKQIGLAVVWSSFLDVVQ